MITKIDIMNYFNCTVKPRCLIIADRTYGKPKKDWLLEVFYPWLSRELKRDGISGWQESFDCDDFATVYRVMAQVCHANTRNGAEGIAIGEVFYTRDNGGQHAINCAFVENEQLIFIEPQNGQQTKLTDKELGSIWYVRF